MPLPILEAPKYEVTIPSSGKKVRFRPYLVKEEKILMIALESQNQKDILTAMKEVVSNCTFGKVDTDNLCTFDLEYLFLKLRAKSVGEISKVGIKCEKCETSTVVEINLDEINVDMSNRPNPTVKLTEEIGITLAWPKMKAAADLVDTTGDEKMTSKVGTAIDVVVSCIESIYDKTKIHKASEQTKEELVQFIENLSQSQFAKIQEFIEAMPKVEHIAKFKCSNAKCAHQNEITLSGMSNFF
jgi:hypothetical protein